MSSLEDQSLPLTPHRQLPPEITDALNCLMPGHLEGPGGWVAGGGCVPAGPHGEAPPWIRPMPPAGGAIPPGWSQCAPAGSAVGGAEEYWPAHMAGPDVDLTKSYQGSAHEIHKPITDLAQSHHAVSHVILRQVVDLAGAASITPREVWTLLSGDTDLQAAALQPAFHHGGEYVHASARLLACAPFDVLELMNKVKVIVAELLRMQFIRRVILRSRPLAGETRPTGSGNRAFNEFRAMLDLNLEAAKLVLSHASGSDAGVSSTDPKWAREENWRTLKRLLRAFLTHLAAAAARFAPNLRVVAFVADLLANVELVEVVSKIELPRHLGRTAVSDAAKTLYEVKSKEAKAVRALCTELAILQARLQVTCERAPRRPADEIAAADDLYWEAEEAISNLERMDNRWLLSLADGVDFDELFAIQDVPGLGRVTPVKIIAEHLVGEVTAVKERVRSLLADLR